MRKIICRAATFCVTAVIFLTSCGTEAALDPKNPVTLTMWHNYGGMMKETMGTLIDEFNATVGKRRGIVVNVTSIAASREQNEKLAMIADGMPGAPEMPDVVTAYPSMAQTLCGAGLLAELDAYFTEAELDAYLPRFIEEGRLPDGKLYVFPIAKSTEALFVNKTYFDRFAADTGVRLDSLSTFEGIADAAVKYYEWSGGKAFFTADSWFNLAQVGTAQLGGSFVGDGILHTGADAFQRIWEFSVLPAIAGGHAVADGYSSDLYKTGDIAACIGSTAGVLFYGDMVVLHADTTSEPIESIVLPYPVFEGGAKIALQRGAGMVVARSDPQKEFAAAVFLKWFAASEQNMRFVSETGYLPVTKEAFDEKMMGEIGAVENPLIKRMLQTAVKTYQEYDFIVAPNVPEFDALSKGYEAELKELMRHSRKLKTERQNIDTRALFDEFTGNRSGG
ncbi:MAG: extracellular solute-binding protein [Clostridiales bacterium]|nr:extracellular solute-binding protein [Clostridiales bacterium]